MCVFKLLVYWLHLRRERFCSAHALLGMKHMCLHVTMSATMLISAMLMLLLFSRPLSFFSLFPLLLTLHKASFHSYITCSGWIGLPSLHLARLLHWWATPTQKLFWFIQAVGELPVGAWFPGVAGWVSFKGHVQLRSSYSADKWSKHSGFPRY